MVASYVEGNWDNLTTWMQLFGTLLPPGVGVYVSSTWIWVGLWMPQPVEHTGNDARWPLRLDHKRLCSFFLVHWNTCPLRPGPLCKNSLLQDHQAREASCLYSAWQPQLSLSFTPLRPSARLVIKETTWTVSSLVPAIPAIPSEALGSMWSHQAEALDIPEQKQVMCVLLKSFTTRRKEHNSMFVVLCHSLHFWVVCYADR